MFTKILAGVAVALASAVQAGAQTSDVAREPYLLDSGLVSRSISFENPTGAPGEGGHASSVLGPGRKGAAFRNIKPGA